MPRYRLKLKEYMDSNGIESQKELAQLTGLSEYKISRMMNSTRIDMDALAVIQAALNCELTDLVEFVINGEPDKTDPSRIREAA